MHYFLDTNVIIGYIFSLDPLNDPSNSILNKKVLFYYSDHVKWECESKFEEKLENYSNFFQTLILYLEDNQNVINRNFLHKIIRKYDDFNQFDKNDMCETIDILLKRLDLSLEYGFEAFELLNKLDLFLLNFESKHYDSFEYIKQDLNKIGNHSKKYPELDDILKGKVHKNDKLILLDVHEFACNNLDLNFILVTWDYDFSNAVKDLLEHFCISDCCYITDFVNS